MINNLTIYKINYIYKDYKYKIFEGDKVIIKSKGKCKTYYITYIGTKKIKVRNGLYKYNKPRRTDGICERWLNCTEFNINEIESIVKYPEFSQIEPKYISDNNWKCR